VADKGVDQCGFARTGGTADDGQQRCVEAAVPRQDVVLELGDRSADLQPGLLDVRQGQRERDGGQVAVNVLQERHSISCLPRGCLLPAAWR
jgi:hypothetical protein